MILNVTTRHGGMTDEPSSLSVFFDELVPWFLWRSPSHAGDRSSKLRLLCAALLIESTLGT